MSLLDVLTGKLPLFKPKSSILLDIEADYQKLINSTTPYQWRRKPEANATLVAEAEKYDNASKPRASARYTLSTQQPVKVADTQGLERRIFFTVLGVGQTAFVSHDRIRIQNNQLGINEGIPLTNAGLGEPALSTLPWLGEMWAIGDTDGMLVDVEMS